LPLGIVVGLQAEARIARRLGGWVAVGGGTGKRARQATLRLVASGATALLSFGLAGGLDPALRPGDVLVPYAVMIHGRRIATDPALCDVLGGATPHMLLAGEQVVAKPAEKQAFWRTTGCAAVDLESGPVGEVATDENLPFAVLRAVCDPAHRVIPPAALISLGASGALALGPLLASLASHPGQLVALLTLARDAAHARRALLRHVARIDAHTVFTTPQSGSGPPSGGTDA
jgi:adenosylhomocysteine nucleosidase